MHKISFEKFDFIEKFSEDFSGLIHKYHDRFLADESISDLDLLMLSIYLLDNKKRGSGAKYEDAKDLFLFLGRKYNNFKLSVHRAKKQNLIEDNKRVLFIHIKGLKRLRGLLGQIGKTPVYIIKSGQNFTAIKLFEEFLAAQIAGDEVLICDSYVSHTTLFPFSILKGKIKSLRVLTANLYDSSKFRDYARRMKKELNISVEVKINRKIHDRFIVSGDKCWSIGASIKDLGNKDATLREISEVASSMKDLFMERWSE